MAYYPAFYDWTLCIGYTDEETSFIWFAFISYKRTTARVVYYQNFVSVGRPVHIMSAYPPV